MASGPSLTTADIETARQWRLAGDDRRVVVTNTTFRVALWADVLFAMDAKWWAVYSQEVRRTFHGEPWTASHSWKRYGVNFSRHVTFGNSGAGAIYWAVKSGATRILLLGYDCQRTDGKSHHHGRHPEKLHDASSMHAWPGQFGKLADAIRGKCEVINCTRQTALNQWPRMALEDAIGQSAKAA